MDLNLYDIITILATAFPLLIATLTFLIKFVKNSKAKKVLQTTLNFTEALQPMIVKAEEYSHYSGEEKKQFVLTQANQFAIDHKLKFNIDTVSELIEEIVSTTKKVNARGKDIAASEKIVAPEKAANENITTQAVTLGDTRITI